MIRRKAFKLMIVFVVLISMITLSGCGGSDDTVTNDETNKEANKEASKETIKETADIGTVISQGDDVKVGDISIGSKAPNFVWKNEAGEEVSLEDYKGKKVLINFWTTTCPYCIKEMPDFQKVYDELKEDDFTILAVDVGESKNTVEKYINENGYTFPVVLDKTGEVGYMYQIKGVPTSVFVDEKGLISGVRLGPMAYPEIKQRLDK